MVFNEYASSYEVTNRKEQLNKVSCLEELKIEKVSEKNALKKDKNRFLAIPFLQKEKSCCCL